MAVREITKQLAGMEDINLGVGVETQTRNGTNYTITKFTPQTVVDAIADLQNVNYNKITNVIVSGYYSIGDGGGGAFYWDSTSTDTDNGGTIIQVTGVATGRWKRIYSGVINVKWFGAKGDGVTDDSLPVTNADTFAATINTSITFPGAISSYKIKNVVLTCAGAFSNGATIIPVADEAHTLITASAGAGKSQEITGLTFDANGSTFSINFIEVKTCESINIHHNKFLNGTFYDIVAQTVDESTIGSAIIDNNYFYSTTAGAAGTTHNLPIEWFPKKTTGGSRPCTSLSFKGNTVRGKFVCKFQNTDIVDIDSIFEQTAAYNQGSSASIEIRGCGDVKLDGVLKTYNSTASLGVDQSSSIDGSDTYTQDSIDIKIKQEIVGAVTPSANLLTVGDVYLKGADLFRLSLSAGSKGDIEISGGSIVRSITHNLGGTADTIDLLRIKDSTVGSGNLFNIYDATWTGTITKLELLNCKVPMTTNTVNIKCVASEILYNAFEFTGTGGGSLFLYGDNATSGVNKVLRNYCNTTKQAFVKATDVVGLEIDENTIKGATLGYNGGDCAVAGGTTFIGRRHNTVDGVDYLTGSAAPGGASTARYIGEYYLRTGTVEWYKASATGTGGWILIG